ncbi:MAG: sigma-70 family RNA polymerase sigma factor [Anaerolineales bacterium]|nr:sigma-70 family RNA polymerase sigma factor [Anaerolineales bacterium]
MDREQALLQGARRFEEGSLVEVYDRYSAGVYGYALRLLGNEDLAEECVAETFHRFLAALKAGRGPLRSIKPYIYQVAHNWITDHYRSKAPALSPLEADVSDQGRGDPRGQMAASQESDRLRAALLQLTVEQRQVLVLRYLEEWDIAEISEAMAKSPGAVKALQHRALASLRRLLRGEE